MKMGLETSSLMPLIVVSPFSNSVYEKIWMEDDSKDRLIKLLNAYPANEMDTYEVDLMVNNPVNDSPEVIKPLT